MKGFSKTTGHFVGNVVKGMLLYAQLLKTKRHFVRKEISSYVKVDENNWHFVSKA